MKIEFFEKSLDVILKRFKLKKENPQEDIIASYLVTIKEAYTNTTYYYVRSKDGNEALYLYPSYQLIAGESFLDKKTLSSLPKKEYKSKQEHIREEITERFFYRLKSAYNNQQQRVNINSIYSKGFDYLTSLYYGEDDTFLEAYNELYNAVKRECDNLGINYETNPEVILKNRLSESYEDSEFKAIDIRICKSKESIDEYFKTHIMSQTDNDKFSAALSDFQYTKASYIMDYNGNFLTNSNKLITALLDRTYPNREEVLKKYMEFFISKDTSFSLAKYMEELISKADEIKYNMEQERYNNNFEFMTDLEKITKHDQDEETYRYHATTSLEDAKRILEEGFYLYSKSLDSTSFPEFSINQILSYSYGNGFEQFGDFIIIISNPKDEDIVEELSEEEQEKVTIIPRRNAIVGNKPTYRVDKKHIVGIIDKKHEKVITNPEYVNNEKKQINM